MSIYRVWVRLEETYDNIEAESEEEAFEIASDYAMEGGCWSREVTLIEDEEDDWDMLDDIEQSEYMRAMAERGEE